ncbi:GMP synthase [Thermosipho sp. 1063]|uniref:glutamine-hydrolyzing GMP synthase n=1 Tax=unclassified Thermosipho (in: thermotogales) TaxID=2676525 RepID=UPI0009493AA3|nr:MULTISPECIES: glutamine-hydrolyzing GMP synthase [unclassified Thermosipho (in: thermotogales)]ANQ53760.1 GMP synthase [Thermosipho sp. 1070]APT72206.1 GMP synthase [Thermosipho sp. 1063]
MKTVVVLDYGSQYTQLIVRRIREKGYYAELLPWDATEEEIKSLNPFSVILSGGPSSVYEKDAPYVPDFILNLKVPILGICYGLQALVYKFGGKVEKSEKREFGHAVLKVKKDPLFEELPEKFDVWMSHSDRVEKLPEGFYVIGESENSPFAAVRNKEGTIYGVQFHPEVTHTQFGSKILENFVSKIAKMPKNWQMSDFVKDKIREIRQIVGNDKVILGLSGGVDSSVVAMLLHKAIGKNSIPIFVDTGLLRLNEREEVEEKFKNLGIEIFVVDAKERFLSALEGVEDPEEKRKIIGHTFIDIFYETSMNLLKEHGNIKYLAQGTLYPDIIESKVSERKSAAKIKTHHNVGGLPEKLPFKIIEPLRYLFKDEVRKLGKILGLPDDMINRHPFPGPGLAVRIVGKITKRAVEILQQADYIFIEELKKNGLYEKVWQAFAVFLPIKSVGVMGDYRTYENVIALRAVNSFDGMTADWSKLPHEFLNKVAKRIINEVEGVNRVVYDITSKPPATIEWE